MIHIFKPKKPAEKPSDAADTCVLCGKQTIYTKDTPLDMSFAYIEGIGQLCFECYNDVYPNSAGNWGESSL